MAKIVFNSRNFFQLKVIPGDLMQVKLEGDAGQLVLMLTEAMKTYPNVEILVFSAAAMRAAQTGQNLSEMTALTKDILESKK